MYIRKIKKILIAGGAGVPGSQLCERPLIEGHKVYAVDNFSSGQWQNIAPLDDNPLFELIEPDISKAGELLNWRPQIALRQGLESTIEYFHDLLGSTRKLAPMPNA